MNNSKGFTLIEILAALTVSLILLLAIGTAIESALKSSSGMERKVIAQQDVRSALEIMAMEIRMASYNPTQTPNPSLWVNPNTCQGLSANPTWKGIQTATPNALTVEMDIHSSLPPAPPALDDGNGIIMGNPAVETNEVISYNYVNTGGNLYITRGTNCGGAQPFLGDVMAGVNPRTVRVVNANLNPPIPIFRYFDFQGNEWQINTTTGVNINQVPNINMIEITLVVDTDEINPDTGQRRRMIYSTREILRNNW
jgi:prepilin-type N-terminal cleavage/methylation domain-containing protein